jgi:hypothetical protein
MRSLVTRIKIPVGALLCLALLVPGAATEAHAAGKHGWVVYRGHRDGLRIVFELNGHRLTPAFVSIPIACTGGHRSRDHFVAYTNRRFPIRVHQDGRFHEHRERIEANGSESETIVGQVTAKKIEGKIAVNFSEPGPVGLEECHSGKHPHGPMEELSFRANLPRPPP